MYISGFIGIIITPSVIRKIFSSDANLTAYSNPFKPFLETVDYFFTDSDQ